MNKMLEAFEKWNPSICQCDDPLSAFEAGYQAAIAAVKEGGIKAYEGMHTSGAPLYKLPEDTP